MTFESVGGIKPFQCVSVVFCIGMNQKMSELGLGPWCSFKYVLLAVGHFAGYSVNLMCCCREAAGAVRLI